MPNAKIGSDGQRLCGTKGCTLRDFHVGPCSNEILDSGKRPRYVPPPPPPPKRKAPAADLPKQKRKAPAVSQLAAAPATPAEQQTMPSGLSLYYHATRWGVPLPEGPVSLDCSDDEVDESWRLRETSARTAARDGVTASEAALCTLWNAHVSALPPLVSDRMVPDACRSFARAHAAALASELHAAFLSHLLVLTDHNLLHRDDVQDCLLIARSAAGVADVRLCEECSRPVHEASCALSGRTRGAAAWPAHLA